MDDKISVENIVLRLDRTVDDADKSETRMLEMSNNDDFGQGFYIDFLQIPKFVEALWKAKEQWWDNWNGKELKFIEDWYCKFEGGLDYLPYTKDERLREQGIKVRDEMVRLMEMLRK